MREQRAYTLAEVEVTATPAARMAMAAMATCAVAATVTAKAMMAEPLAMIEATAETELMAA